MSLNRHAKKRDDNESEIVKALEKLGAKVHRIDQPVDLLVDFRRRWYLVEVKNAEGRDRLTDAQEELMRTAQAPVFVVRTALEAVKKISAFSPRPINGE